MSDNSIPKYSRPLINIRITCPRDGQSVGDVDSVTTCTANLQPFFSSLEHQIATRSGGECAGFHGLNVFTYSLPLEVVIGRSIKL